MALHHASEISVTPARQTEIDEVLRLYAWAFHGREPLMNYLGFSEERMVSIARALYANRTNDLLEEGLWLIARDMGTAGAPAGFIISSDLLTDKPTELPEGMTTEEKAKVPPILALMEKLRRPVNERFSLKKGECLHIAALGIVPGYEGLGIATQLLETVLARARGFGYLYAASECTGPASRRCHEKCGFRSLVAVAYAGFLFERERPFGDVPGECHMMWRELQ